MSAIDEAAHPPLRKKHSQVKTVALKQLHVEQLSKLQHKHQQHDNDLLEDICNFASRRSKIEKDYAQALLKLTNGLMQRKDPFQIQELTSEEGKEYKNSGRTIATVWHTVLEETEKIAKIRLQAAETYMHEVADPIKSLKTIKQQNIRKLLDQLATTQGEVTQSVRELNKVKKIYTDEEKLAHDARQKSSEAEDKVKRRSTGLFSSLASLQKTSAKLSSRKDLCESKSVSARNSYLLSLAAANAHLIRFYSLDLPDIMKAMDGDMYERVQQVFIALSKTELECCGITQECFSKVLCDSTQISRQYNLQCLLNQNLVFTDLVQYSFEQYENDPITKVVDDPKCEPTLENEAKKWANKVAKENKTIHEYSRVLQSIITGTYTGDKKVTDPTSPESEVKDAKQPEVEMTIDGCKEIIRKAETSKMKAEARLDLIRDAGIDVDDLLSRANQETLSPVDAEDVVSRTSVGDVSHRTYSSGGQSEASPNGTTTYQSYNYEEDFSDEPFSDQSQRQRSCEQTPAATAAGAVAIALYEFTASNADELNMKANECVTVIGPGDAPGWLKAVSEAGQEGLVPENYVQMMTSDTAAAGSGSVNGDTTPWPNNTNNDTAWPNSDSTWPNQDPFTDTNPASGFDNQTFTWPDPAASSDDVIDKATSDVTNPSSFSSTDYEVQNVTETQHNGMAAGDWVRAIYAYDASNPEELELMEGQLIRLIKRDDDVGDGWWTGEVDGRVGLFPSLVVEELTDQFCVDDMVSPVRPGPPPFAPPDMTDAPPNQPFPPPVTVTLPTPSDDDTPITLLDLDESESSTDPPDTAAVVEDQVDEIDVETAMVIDSDQSIENQPTSVSNSPRQGNAQPDPESDQVCALDPGLAASDLSSQAEAQVTAANERRRSSDRGSIEGWSPASDGQTAGPDLTASNVVNPDEGDVMASGNGGTEGVVEPGPEAL